MPFAFITATTIQPNSISQFAFTMVKRRNGFTQIRIKTMMKIIHIIGDWIIKKDNQFKRWIQRLFEDGDND